MTDTTRTPAVTSTAKGGVLTLVFSHGRELILDTAHLDAAVYNQALMHGLKQKLVDAAAISRNPNTGRTASIDDKFDAVREVYDRLLSGQWNKGRDGTASPKGGLLFRALCIVYASKTAEQIRAIMATKTKEDLAALRKLPKIVAAIEELKAADATDNDTDNTTATDGFED